MKGMPRHDCQINDVCVIHRNIRVDIPFTGDERVCMDCGLDRWLLLTFRLYRDGRVFLHGYKEYCNND